MSGTILVRNDWFEVVHGTLNATKWIGDHYLGHTQPPGDPSGVAYRARDLKRPYHIDHGDFVWVALRL
eukprot:2676694-Lingulodinium_polyedra.AAC.1